MIIGYLDNFTGGHIFGWMGSFSTDVLPFITANGKPCILQSKTLHRPDVAEATGLDADVGFVAEVPHIEHTKIEFELFAITTSGKKLIDRKSFIGASINPRRFCSIFDALDIARQKDAVAITCWDGTHNAISRAFTLYNIVKHERPTVIFAFDIGFSEHSIWSPLINSAVKLLIIPWKDRAIYFDLFRNIGLNFNTIWICGQYYPSFELTKYIATANSSFVLDLQSNNSRLLTAKQDEQIKLFELMARPFIEKISTRSAAHLSDGQGFNVSIIRDARKANLVTKERKTDFSQEVRIGFIGTITPNQGLVEAAKTINFINKTHGYKIKLVVAGEFSSDGLRADLSNLGCEIHGYIDLNNLNSHIENLDVVLTGFPISNSSDVQNKIPSIIGDALCNSRPVLVPSGTLLNDLAAINGIYVFTAETFLSCIQRAVSDANPITLNEQFSIDFNYKIFSALEQRARNGGPKFGDLFGYHDETLPQAPTSNSLKLINIVLVWKQHDSGLYGRRVDQVARSLSTQKVAHNVFLLEIATPQQIEHYRGNSSRLESDNCYIYNDFREKEVGVYKNGVFYQSLVTDSEESFSAIFNRFLINKGLFPRNTLFINFPAITEFPQLLKSQDGYVKFTDVVDNQLSWETKNPLPLISQYLSFIHASEKIIFNSEKNKNFFIENGLSSEKLSFFVPNWYKPPTSFKAAHNKTAGHLSILYSGNMNDRIDWELLKLLHDSISENVRIHLVGSADRALGQLMEILETRSKFIYHGPMREGDLLRFAASCDLAIMPHLHDECSTFMNPMKVNMYSSIGLRCISTDIPGIDRANKYLTVCNTSSEFVSRTIGALRDGSNLSEVTAIDQIAINDLQYIELIKRGF